LPSQWVERWKEADSGGSKAKSRLVVLGWKGPDVFELERSAPTPTNEGLAMGLQHMASMGWACTSSDVKNAFGQGMKDSRRQPLAMTLPLGTTYPGAQPGQLLLLRTEAYGLVSGPSWWRKSLVHTLKGLGYRENPYDACVYTLPAEVKTLPAYNRGVVIINVDDLMEGGGHQHQANMAELRQKFLFGKVVKPHAARSGRHSARWAQGEAARRLPV